MSDCAEEWRAVSGAPYEVSDLGRVRRVSAYRSTWRGRILKPWPKRNGYLGVSLSVNGRVTTAMVAHLVCAAFHGPKPSPNHHAAHRDENRQNNRADNLRWATPQENEADKTNPVRGSRHPFAKLREADIPVIRELIAQGVSPKKIAERFGVSSGKIHHIKTGRSWKNA